MPLALQITLEAFNKSFVDFVGMISPPRKNTGMHYIIITKEYLTRWAEVTLVKYCTIATAKKFLFENVVTRFDDLKIIVSEQSMHFVKKMIDEFTAKFQIHHRKTTPYHLQPNGTVKSFNKILENALIKVCNERRDD